MADYEVNDTDIAIIGMAARLPGARTIPEYWDNLRSGVESVVSWTEEQLLAAGESPENIAHPSYVRASAPLPGMEDFDAEFFGFSPKEAAIMDPQHRQFIEAAWEALEDAGHTPDRFDGRIGVFGGCGMGSYFYFNLCSNPELVEDVGLFLLRHTGNDKDFLVTRLSYLLNLTGPSVNVQTACSTSLVAVHMGCQSLLSFESDMVLAGGVTIDLPHRRGYFYKENEVLSPDGHCHAFDHRGQGTVFGSGAGIVVLRRLADALEAGDPIHAIIKGSAVNNDGASKVGYLAPSVDGQSQAMVEAHQVANLSADSIGYVECHGTGTYMGDPIEIAALTNAFRQTTDKKQFCRIGSVKTNIGHLDTAAGVASLIKASLTVREGWIPPSLNFEAPNPTIDFESSPFIVNTELKEWKSKAPRRAAVNSLGVGGTNAHVIVEQPPPRKPSCEAKRGLQLLCLSARNKKSLDGQAARLADHLERHPEQKLADVAYTLLEGRRGFEQRRVLAVESREEAIQLLREPDAERVFSHPAADKASIVFSFPGGGAQYPKMGLGLYETEPVYKEWIDRGLAWLEKKRPDLNHRRIFFEEGEALADEFAHTWLQLPVIFLVEFAMAKLLMSWGVEPEAMIGHSLGEKTAACLAGVFSFEDALGLCLLRGEIIRDTAEGGMMSVPMSAEALRQILPEDLDLGIINGPELCVVSGAAAAIDRFQAELEAKDVQPRRVKLNAAGHSRLFDPILERYGEYLRTLKLSPPKLKIVSNRTGTWMTAEQATSPDYWVEHLRYTVQFQKGMETLLETPGRIFVEVGPGRILSSLARLQKGFKPGQAAISTMRHPDSPVGDAVHFLTTLGRVWAAGAGFDHGRQWEGETRHRVSLPTYAFNHGHYWIERKATAWADAKRSVARLDKVDDWFFRPTWRARPVEIAASTEAHTWLIFIDEAGLGGALAERLEAAGDKVVRVVEGDAYVKKGPRQYILAPERGREGYDALVRDLVAGGLAPDRVLHLWMVTPDESFRPGSSFFHRNLERGFYSLFFLAQALSAESVPAPLHITMVSSDMQAVTEAGVRYPEKSTLLGPVQVIPREFPGFTCASVDLTLPEKEDWIAGLARDPRRVLQLARRNAHALEPLVETLHEELRGLPASQVVALREGHRWVREYDRVRCAPPAEGRHPALADGGRYLITGGLGGLGLLMARHVVESVKAPKLLLVGRSAPSAKKRALIAELEAAGAEIRIAQADITDVEGLGLAVQEAEAAWGKLNGVFHTAGVVKDELIAMKSQAGCEDVFAPKIHGTVVIDKLFADGHLDFVVLFSSTSTVIAPPGQIDYVAANAFLNAYAAARAERRTRWIAIDWGIWSEVGMAAVAFAPEAQDAIDTIESHPAHHPLFDARVHEDERHTVLTARYATGTHWILDEHRTRAGHALIPGTGYIELARAALAEYGERGPFEIGDLFFIRPLHVSDDEPKDVRVRLRRTEEGYSFEVRSRRVLDGGRAGWELHAQASLRLMRLPPAETVDLEAIDARCQRERSHVDPTGIHSPQERHLEFGPRWRVLNQLSYGEGEGLARLSLPEAFRGDLEHWALHPALLDLATGWAMNLIQGYDADASELWVPVSYRSIRVRGPLPAEVRSWVKSHGQNSADKDFAAFDVVISDPEGRPLLEIDEFTIKRMPVSDDHDFAVTSEPSAAEIEMEKRAGDAERQLSPAERVLRENLRKGIKPAEGREALDRVLAGPRVPVTVVSSMPLDGLIEQLEQLAESSGDSGTKFARPELDSDYIAPRDDVERTLVGFWEDLLGVDRIGVEDNFFDLGGHSLIAVRLFAKVKKTWSVDFPISVLFEAPTVERCASLVKDVIGEVAPSTETTDAPASRKSAAPPRRFTHLVAMHPGEGGPKRPFFLVAGMFGNVLNLRHLAHMLGNDRPFYGLQARGLYGDLAPHETFEEMARDYLAELRQVQPKGPYLLGGFSGGGITAYEMAQQLAADGEEVKLLVMLDSLVARPREPSKQDKLRVHALRIRRLGPKYLRDWAEERLEWELGKIKAKMGDPVEHDASEFHNEAIEAAFRRALSRYTVRPYAGPVTLFRPKLDQAYVLAPDKILNSHMEIVSHDNDWGAYVGSLEVCEVPGDHDSMVLEPNVRVLVARLRDRIKRAEARIEEEERARRAAGDAAQEDTRP
jgi:acyl transferase domain-containing protein/thioesterase domain-containing protein